MHKVLGVVSLLTLGWLILLWYALAYGATAFPFTRTDQNFGPNWERVGEVRSGRCEGTGFLVFHLKSQDARTGWQIYYSANDRLVAVRYALDAEEGGSPNLIVFAKLRQTAIEIQEERAFDPALDTGPCQWFEEKAT